MKNVIIGNSAAAVGAVEGIRQTDSVSQITIITDEPHHTYARPLISYLLSGKVTKERMSYRPHDFYAKNDVDVLFAQKAVRIDPTEKQILLAHGDPVAYDNLLVATGSRPARLEIAGIDKENVFLFYNMNDALTLKDKIRVGMKGVVLGAGLTAIKAAESLVALGVETTLVVRSRLLRNFLDVGAGELLQNHLVQKGLQLSIGSEPVEIAGGDCAEAVILADGSKLPCDFVISAVGIEANTDIVSDIPVKVEQGIRVDTQMRTGVPGIYAAGDVAQGIDLLTGSRRIIPLLPVAYAQGETAGRNMAGEAAEYSGMGMNAVSFFGLPVISAGVINEGTEDQVHLAKECGQAYRKLVFRENRLTGFVLIDQIDRAGILTWLIRERIDISEFKESLLDGTFNYAFLPAELRRQKISVAI